MDDTKIEEIPVDDFASLAAVHPDGTPPKLSARLYEFFFTTFAQHNTCLHAGINIGEQYLQNSKHFSFFRRKPEVIFGIKPSGLKVKHLEVTKPQLALFRWIYDNDIHNYIVLHMDKIKVAMQNFKKIPKSQISHESKTLDRLTSNFADMTLKQKEDEEESVRLGVPRNRRFHNREVLTRKKIPVPHAHCSLDDTDMQMHKEKERRAKQLELQRLADLKRLERQQQELRDKEQKALQKQWEKEAAKEAKKQMRKSKGTKRHNDHETATAEWLYPASPTDSQFRRQLGW